MEDVDRRELSIHRPSAHLLSPAPCVTVLADICGGCIVNLSIHTRRKYNIHRRT